jgi:hypothetical protein
MSLVDKLDSMNDQSSFASITQDTWLSKKIIVNNTTFLTQHEMV